MIVLIQAAELMAWAILAYPDTPLAFRDGLLKIALDEVRHMRLYRAHIERLGYRVGDFAVRDWFWMRVPTCPDPASFVAVMGLGLEWLTRNTPVTRQKTLLACCVSERSKPRTPRCTPS